MSAHHEHQRVGPRVSEAAGSFENAETAVKTVVFGAIIATAALLVRNPAKKCPTGSRRSIKGASSEEGKPRLGGCPLAGPLVVLVGDVGVLVGWVLVLGFNIWGSGSRAVH